MTEPAKIRDALFGVAQRVCGEFSLTEGKHGRITAWMTLRDKASLVPCCRSLKDAGARLSMITAMAGAGEGVDMIAYHFDLDGSTATVKVSVASGDSVETIVPIFRNADWHEREFIELYDIGVHGRADTRRLFLDESVDGQVMERLIPLSVLSNAASTNMLFERLLQDREVQ